jgi:GPH family glycoside/pentoside/hexuronide:cation symporter
LVTAELQPAPPTDDSDSPLSARALFYYCLPGFGVSFSFVLTVAYITKYSIDVLLMAPATIGLILGAARIWDAITDPLIGNFSDRTRSALGRRRPWLLASALPIAVLGLLVWSPPRSLEGTALTVWMTLTILAFFTAQTAFIVPHYALGAELSQSYHKRTLVFGLRQAVWALGMGVALVFAQGALARSPEPRETAFMIFAVVGVVCVITISGSVFGLRERATFQGRGGKNPYRAFLDVGANPHGRRLLIMLFIEHMGAGSSMVLSPFLLHYVIGVPGAIGTVFAFYIGSILLSIVVWVKLSRIIGKKNTWLIAMGVAMLGYATLLNVGHGDVGLMCFVTVLTGAASSCGRTIGSSIQADVIDFDEYQTGERKEGSYYAAFTFLEKTSSGIMAMIAGLMLQWVGFEPNMEQTEDTKLAIRTLMGTVPLVSFGVGAAIFWGFRLTEEEHARIRAELDARQV